MEMLDLVSVRSTCFRRSVGAIIVDAQGHILATGYNGVPRGVPHCDADHRCAGAGDQQGDSRRCMAVHAEQNALTQCHRLDLAYTMYVSCCPCFACAKMIMNTVIARVVAQRPYSDDGAELLLRKRGLLWMWDFENANAVKLSAINEASSSHDA